MSIQFYIFNQFAALVINTELLVIAKSHVNSLNILSYFVLLRSAVIYNYILIIGQYDSNMNSDLIKSTSKIPYKNLSDISKFHHNNNFDVIITFYVIFAIARKVGKT